MTDNKAETILLNDSQWSLIDGEPCRVVKFTPLVGWVEGGKVESVDNRAPNASVSMECKKFPHEVTGFITHKLDFANLWAAFKERGVRAGEEVIIIWTTKHYKYKFLKFLTPVYPKMWVMICQKGALEILVDPNWKPELTGEAPWNAEKTSGGGKGGGEIKSCGKKTAV